MRPRLGVLLSAGPGFAYFQSASSLRHGFPAAQPVTENPPKI
jgi:hypothetical protein